MQRRSRARLGTVLALVVSLAALVPTGAVAATQSVTIALSSFSPSSKTIARGDTVQWRNEDHTSHDVKSDLPGYFSSPDGAGGMFFKDMYVKSFKQAGSFGYFCRAHKSTTPHEGTIVVPIKVTRDGNTFTIVAASQSMAGTKWRNRIQVKDPGSSTWKSVKTTSARSATYFSTKSGTFRFRSATKDSETGATSGWSPVVSKSG